MEDVEKIILLIVAGQGVLLTLAMLYSFRKNSYSNLFTGLITYVLTIEILNYYGMRIGYHSSAYPIPFWSLGTYLILPPSLYLMIRCNFYPDFKPKRVHLLLFVPAIVEIVLDVSVFYIARHTQTNYDLINNPIYFTLTEISPLLGMIALMIYFGLALYRLIKRDDSLRTAIHQHLRLSVIWVFGVILVCVWSLSMVTNSSFYFISLEVLVLVFIGVVGFLGYTHQSFFSIPKTVKRFSYLQSHKYFDHQGDLNRLHDLFMDQKLFRRKKLSLKEVSMELALPERYVSHLIKDNYNQSFNMYVNSFRVQDIINRIQSPHERYKTLFAIALESGFNSKSSFNSVFKHFTGKNPSEYLNP